MPPKINWYTQLVNALSRADFLLGKLAREGGKLPNPHLLIRPFIIIDRAKNVVDTDPIFKCFFEATRDEYYKQLYSVSAKGTWNEWLVYFLNGIAVQTEDVLSRAERINDLLSKWKIQVASSVSSVPMLSVQHFAVNPYLTTNKIVEELKIAYSTAQRSIQKLEEAKIIKQIRDNKRDKI